MALNELNEDSSGSPNVIDFSIITAKTLSGFWMEHLLRVFIFQPTDNYSMLDSECYFAIYSETKNLILWKVSWYKWHNNKSTKVVTVTKGDKDKTVPLSSQQAVWIAVHVVTYKL